AQGPAAADAVGPSGAEVVVRGRHGIFISPGARANHGAAADRGAVASATAHPATKEVNVTFLKRRVSATIWELLILLVFAIVLATVYRIYFSRAVALTQVCERLE